GGHPPFFVWVFRRLPLTAIRFAQTRIRREPKRLQNPGRNMAGRLNVAYTLTSQEIFTGCEEVARESAKRKPCRLQGSFFHLLCPENLYSKISNEQMLGFGHELPVGARGMISKAGIAARPIRQHDNHSSAFLDETLRRIQSSRLFFEFGSLFLKKSREFSDL